MPAPAASYLLWAAKQSFPTKQTSHSPEKAEQAAGLTPHREGTTRLLEQSRDSARGEP